MTVQQLACSMSSDNFDTARHWRLNEILGLQLSLRCPSQTVDPEDLERTVRGWARLEELLAREATVVRRHQRILASAIDRNADSRSHRHYHGYMNPEAPNNARLRELIEAAGVTQAVALTIFNRGLGPAGYSMAAFKAFLANPSTVKFRPLKTELLAHAEKQFARLKDA